jgi:hypothetical protein
MESNHCHPHSDEQFEAKVASKKVTKVKYLNIFLCYK